MKLDNMASEYRGALLGDPQRTKRLERIACEFARNPGLSFPEATGIEEDTDGACSHLSCRPSTFRS
jgi:hypothetical protein